MNLSLTLDYELFGNGSGDVFKHMIESTNRLLEMCDKYDIKITIFFEILEYVKIKEAWDSGIKMGYKVNPATAIENQIKYAHAQGHDIQLHLHPQWLNAKYDNKWIVDNLLWRLPEVKKENCGYSISELLKFGKETIENIIKPIAPHYECNILRAGGYNIQPSNEVIEAMKVNDFVADSSVYPGAYIISELSKYDYRKINKDIPYWWINNGDVLKSSSDRKDILEIPVFALPVRRIQKFDRQRLKVKLNNKDYIKEQLKQKVGNKSLLQKFKYYFEDEVVTWDYSLFNIRKMNKFLKVAKVIDSKSSFKNHAFVLIGHSKEMYYFNSLETLIKKYLKDEFRFLTMKEYWKTICSRFGNGKN